MTIPQPPPGQGPVDPRGAFAPPPGPPGGFSPVPPMMMMPPPYYPPPRGSFTRAIFMTLATTIFGLSIAANIYFLIFAGILGGSESAEQTVLVSGDPKQKVAVVDINGIIDENTFIVLDKMLKQVESDENVKAVVVQVDTLGGEVGASDEIYHRLVKYKEDRHVPIVVAMGSFATSGGYYVSCAADQIVAQRTTWTGNIGVLFPRYDLSQLLAKWGVSDETIAPDATPYKLAGDPTKPMTPDERQYWLGLVDDAFATFKDVIKTGRGDRLKDSLDTIANGKAYTASEAKKLGLIDQIGYQSDAYDLAGSLAKLSNKQVVRYEPAPSLIDAITGRSQSQSSMMQSMSINGVNVKLDRHWLEELRSPKVMYLWRGQ
jgi:protease-4